MAEAECEILEMRLTPGGLAALIRCPADIQPAPGQYLLGHLPSAEELLPTPLFRMDVYPPQEEVFLVAPPLPAGWTAGDVLRIRGPLGRGFSLSPSARSVALAAWGEPLEPLLPLLTAALQQGAAVAVYSQHPPEGLPLSVEVMPFGLLPEAVRWADALALHIAQADLPRLPEWLGLKPGERMAANGQVLIKAPMPCGGRAQCGVCTQQTRRGPVLLCREGPVVDLQELELG